MTEKRVSAKSERLDPRVRRTRLLLREALLALMREKGFQALNVRDITGRAQVNRSTFYLHYQDKDDLLTQSMKDMLEELWESLERVEFSFATFRRGLEVWLEHVAANAELYQLLLDRRGAYENQLRGYLERRLAPSLEALSGKGFARIPVALRLRFLVSAYLGVMGWWLNHQRPHSPQQLAEWLWSLTRSQLRSGARSA